MQERTFFVRSKVLSRRFFVTESHHPSDAGSIYKFADHLIWEARWQPLTLLTTSAHEVILSCDRHAGLLGGAPFASLSNLGRSYVKIYLGCHEF